MSSYEVIKVHYTGWRAIVILVALVSCFISYSLIIFVKAAENSGEMRDVLHMRVVAATSGRYQKDLEALLKKSAYTAADHARLEEVADSTRVKLTGFDMRGYMPGKMVFRIHYTVGINNPEVGEDYYTAGYRPLTGWRLADIYRSPKFYWDWAILRFRQP